MPRTIATDRLTLRPFRTADAAVVAACVNDLAVSRWLTTVPHPYTADDGADFIARYADAPLVFAAIHADRLIGCVSVLRELGYWFAKSSWGQGFATEAARAVVAAHFDAGGGDLRSGYVLGNAASRNVLEKLGFVPDAIETTTLKSTGETVEVQKMQLARGAFEGAA